MLTVLRRNFTLDGFIASSIENSDDTVQSQSITLFFYAKQARRLRSRKET